MYISADSWSARTPCELNLMSAFVVRAISLISLRKGPLARNNSLERWNFLIYLSTTVPSFLRGFAIVLAGFFIDAHEPGDVDVVILDAFEFLDAAFLVFGIVKSN